MRDDYTGSLGVSKDQRITALEERLAELEAALLKIAAIVETQAEPDIDAIHDIAREALNK